MRIWEFFQLLAFSKENRSSLVQIDLASEIIGLAGVKELSKALRSNTFVRTIDLTGNQIGSKGAKILARVLSENVLIYSISLAGNNIDENGREALDVWVQERAQMGVPLTIKGMDPSERRIPDAHSQRAERRL